MWDYVMIHSWIIIMMPMIRDKIIHKKGYSYSSDTPAPNFASISWNLIRITFIFWFLILRIFLLLQLLECLNKYQHINYGTSFHHHWESAFEKNIPCVFYWWSRSWYYTQIYWKTGLMAFIPLTEDQWVFFQKLYKRNRGIYVQPYIQYRILCGFQSSFTDAVSAIQVLFGYCKQDHDQSDHACGLCIKHVSRQSVCRSFPWLWRTKGPRSDMGRLFRRSYLLGFSDGFYRETLSSLRRVFAFLN